MFKNLLIVSALVSSVSAFAAVEKIAVDPASSSIVYIGKKVTGSHTGEVKITEGALSFEGTALKAAEFTVDMSTINNNDLTDQEYNKKFIDHMNSADFFDTATYKTAKFTSTKIAKVKGDTYKVTGNLTIKDQTHPVTFNATATKAAAKAELKFDRTKYNVKYNSGKFFQGLGDKLINDDVQLTVSLTAKK